MDSDGTQPHIVQGDIADYEYITPFGELLQYSPWLAFPIVVTLHLIFPPSSAQGETETANLA